MAKWLYAVILFFVTNSVFADLSTTITNVNNCLTGGASTASGSKSSCIQSAINAEMTNQQATLFRTYANYTNPGISYYGVTFNTQTPSTPGGGAGSTQSAAPAGNISPFYPVKPSTPVQGQSVPSQSSGATTVPPPPPKPTGGIQYY